MFALFLVFTFILLVFLHLDTVLLLKLLQPQRVGHQSLVSSLFLLLDRKEGVFSDFGGSISSTICKLCCDEVLVRGADLLTRISHRGCGEPGVNSPCRSHLP